MKKLVGVLVGVLVCAAIVFGIIRKSIIIDNEFAIEVRAEKEAAAEAKAAKEEAVSAAVSNGYTTVPCGATTIIAYKIGKYGYVEEAYAYDFVRNAHYTMWCGMDVQIVKYNFPEQKHPELLSLICHIDGNTNTITFDTQTNGAEVLYNNGDAAITKHRYDGVIVSTVDINGKLHDPITAEYCGDGNYHVSQSIYSEALGFEWFNLSIDGAITPW